MASTYQDLLNSVAALIGGTQYTANGAPNLYSGHLAGDSTGISGINAAYSAPPAILQDPPVAIVLPGSFRVNSIGPDEENVDEVRILVLVAPNDPETQMPNLAPYRDSVPNVFKAKFLLNQGTAATYQVLNGFIRSGQPIQQQWGGVSYLGWEFVLEVIRDLTPTYTA